MERNDRLIRKKIYKYMLNGVLNTIALQLGNVVDAIIVGNLIGSIGNAVISTASPYIYTLQAITILLGSGGALSIAVLLGKREISTAGKVMGACIYAITLYSLFFAFLSPILVPSFVRYTGVQGQLSILLGDYIQVFSLGIPFISFVIGMAYYIGVDNHPALASRIYIVANAANLVLDYILVRYTSLGIKGAALSTALGYIIAGIIFIPQYFKSKNRMVTPSFRIHHILEVKSELFNTIKSGFPNLLYLILTVIGISTINKNIVQSIGNDYYMAYAVTSNTQNIVQMFLNGISSVIASVAGVLYGEKDYFRIRVVLSRTVKTALLVSVAIMAIFIAVPQAIAAMYGFNNQAVLPELLVGLRFFALGFCFLSLNAISQNYYRTIGRISLSMLSSTMQLLVLKVPLIILGLRTWGFRGIFIAIIFSELLSFVILNVVRIILQMKAIIPQKGFMTLPENSEERICDISVTGSDVAAVMVSEKIIDYCVKEDIPVSKGNMLGLASEEMISNISKYGYPKGKEKNIDICLSRKEEKLYLRIRDDGIPFDPTLYTGDENNEISGLKLLKKLAIKISYIRVLDLNNTIFEIEV